LPKSTIQIDPRSTTLATGVLLGVEGREQAPRESVKPGIGDIDNARWAAAENLGHRRLLVRFRQCVEEIEQAAYGFAHGDLRTG
jgi:hypothetical protein